MRHRELRVVTGAENDFLTCALTITEPHYLLPLGQVAAIKLSRGASRVESTFFVKGFE
jgi:hypothetical protein